MGFLNSLMSFAILLAAIALVGGAIWSGFRSGYAGENTPSWDDEEDEEEAFVGWLPEVSSDNYDVGPTPAARRHGGTLVDGHRIYPAPMDD